MGTKQPHPKGKNTGETKPPRPTDKKPPHS